MSFHSAVKGWRSEVSEFISRMEKKLRHFVLILALLLRPLESAVAS